MITSPEQHKATPVRKTWRRLWTWLTGRHCPCCRRVVARSSIKRRRLNTAYVDDASNWLTSCSDCHDEALSYFDEMWAEYYAGRL